MVRSPCPGAQSLGDEYRSDRDRGLVERSFLMPIPPLFAGLRGIAVTLVDPSRYRPSRFSDDEGIAEVEIL